jgi:SAM-dependent methyltransferase
MTDQASDVLNTQRVREYGKQVDFGKTASDYGRWRAGYPDELYRRLAAFGIGVAGQQILDLATGTGFLGRGFARRGCAVVGLDISLPLMTEARRLDREESLAMNYVRAKAENLPIGSAPFDVVSAGQSWHWFERVTVAREARRVLRPGGWLVIAHFDWIPLEGNVVDATEQLIMRHNPAWRLNGGLGIHPVYARDVGLAGFVDLETFSFDVNVPYTHEGWRGRIRASAGIGGQLSPEKIAAFDADHAAILKERFRQDPLDVLHRTFAIVCRAGRE